MGERNGAWAGGRGLNLNRLVFRRQETRRRCRRDPEGAPAGAGTDPVLRVAVLVGAAWIIGAGMPD